MNAPADARITIGDQEIGYGQSRRDSLAPGNYVVRADLPAIEGCGESLKSMPVTIVAGGNRTVTLTPKLCGVLEVRAVGRDDQNKNVVRELWYTLTPDGAQEEADVPLPVSGLRKVVPVGKYTLRVKMRNCAPYDDTFEIFAGESISRQSIALICP